MSQFQTKVITGNDAFAQNREDMFALIEKLRNLETRAEALSEKRRPRFEERNQLTPRERLKRLLDPGMPFLSLYNMANYLVDDPNEDTSVPGANVISGIGFINGQFDLFVDFCFKNIITSNNITSSINDRKFFSIPVTFTIMSIACYTTNGINNSLSPLNQSIKKCGFTNVWTTYNSYNISHQMFRIAAKIGNIAK